MGTQNHVEGIDTIPDPEATLSDYSDDKASIVKELLQVPIWIDLRKTEGNEAGEPTKWV